MQEQQSVLDKLQIDVSTMRRLVEHSRPQRRQHPDIDKLEMDVGELLERWQGVQTQAADRYSYIRTTCT